MTATITGTTAESRESLAGKAFGIDIGSLATSLVDAGVRRAVESEVAAVSNQAVKEAITDDVRERLRERATAAAGAAITDQLDGQLNTEDDPEEPAPELYYGSVDEWMREWLRWTYRRHCDGRNRYWSAEWWRSGEATSRLESLWRAWEELRLDEATGMSVWWRDHCDHHMPILMSDQGPFARVATKPENQNEKGDPLPYAPPPKGMFPDVRELNDQNTVEDHDEH
ncbi:hypothetical protein GCM10011575_47250 [Microlunatus endophyticus]|uniref:DUF4913 domain-containing protein n=1 Tax=Microlunatus endophyticus TaxID=1716077 RepID=A0A917WA66_9ACTN|nr:DUF4913 domain-containing protein [Microlunatus endophyticus]GGL83456.1 hypothetical protein GCM10011575_47250 [Microlunatus endophyticus]